MASIILKIDPQLLPNPDLDIRYALPDLIAKESDGLIQDDGYDYAQDQQMLIFLTTEQIKEAISCIVQVIEQSPVLDNNLRKAVIVAVQKDSDYEVVYPPDYQGIFNV